MPGMLCGFNLFVSSLYEERTGYEGQQWIKKLDSSFAIYSLGHGSVPMAYVSTLQFRGKPLLCLMVFILLVTNAIVHLHSISGSFLDVLNINSLPSNRQVRQKKQKSKKPNECFANYLRNLTKSNMWGNSNMLSLHCVSAFRAVAYR